VNGLASAHATNRAAGRRSHGSTPNRAGPHRAGGKFR